MIKLFFIDNESHPVLLGEILLIIIILLTLLMLIMIMIFQHSNIPTFQHYEGFVFQCSFITHPSEWNVGI